MGSAGVGSPSYITGELFKMMTGLNMVHVPYRGSPAAFTDLIAGQVQVSFGSMSVSISHISAGTVRPLAVTTMARSAALPDLPSVGEFIPGHEASAVWGLGAPRNTPVEIIDKLNKEINAALAEPKLKGRFTEMGISPTSSFLETESFIINELGLVTIFGLVVPPCPNSDSEIDSRS